MTLQDISDRFCYKFGLPLIDIKYEKLPESFGIFTLVSKSISLDFGQPDVVTITTLIHELRHFWQAYYFPLLYFWRHMHALPLDAHILELDAAVFARYGLNNVQLLQRRQDQISSGKKGLYMTFRQLLTIVEQTS